jgi:hypothetical protein
MADIGEDQDLGARNRCGDMVGMLPLDSFVMLAVHHPHRYPNLAQLGIGPVRLGFPHLSDLIVESGVLPRCCGEPRIFPPGARNEGGEGGVVLEAVLDGSLLPVKSKSWWCP